MRQMSFSMTTGQVRRQEKTVTRRLGWDNLEGGDLVQAVEKGQGLKKGEYPVKMCVIRIKGKRPERLSRMIDDPDYGREECIKEGFPNLTPQEFVAMFCKANNCEAWQPINRIEFEYPLPLPGIA